MEHMCACEGCVRGVRGACEGRARGVRMRREGILRLCLWVWGLVCAGMLVCVCVCVCARVCARAYVCVGGGGIQ